MDCIKKCILNVDFLFAFGRAARVRVGVVLYPATKLLGEFNIFEFVIHKCIGVIVVVLIENIVYYNIDTM